MQPCNLRFPVASLSGWGVDPRRIHWGRPKKGGTNGPLVPALLAAVGRTCGSRSTSRGQNLTTGSWLHSGDVVEVNWDDVWWPCDIIEVRGEQCTVKYHDGGDVEEAVEVADRVRKPRPRMVDLDSFVEVWCEGLWRPGYVRSVDTDSVSCDIEFQNGDIRQDVPLCELRAPQPSFEGRFMEAWHDSNWSECEVLEATGGRFKVRFLDGEEHEVTKVREPLLPIYMLYVGQRCEGIVTRISTDGGIMVDIGAEEVAQIPVGVFTSAPMRGDIDLGQILDLRICGVDPGGRRILVTPWHGNPGRLPPNLSEKQQRFRRYILRKEGLQELRKEI